MCGVILNFEETLKMATSTPKILSLHKVCPLNLSRFLVHSPANCSAVSACIALQCPPGRSRDRASGALRLIA